MLSVLLLVVFTTPSFAVSEAGLTELEKDVIKEVNLARSNPKEYARIIKEFLAYYDGKLIKIEGQINLRTKEGKRAVKEAIKFLKKQKPLAELTPSRGLSLASGDHVSDQSSTGDLGHASSNGDNPFDRMSKYGKWLVTAGENIDYGNNIGRRVVMALIIDDGIKSRGHRTNIFKPDFKSIGVACGTHTVYRHMCVMDLAGGYSEMTSGGDFSIK